MLILVLCRKGVHKVNHLRDHLSREGRENVVELVLLIVYAM
jgi:hypothetical protein